MADLSTIEQQLTTAIGQQETANGTTGVGASLNNPDGLKYADWESKYGATMDASGFAKFPTLQNGYQAATALIDTYITNGLSLTGLLDKWNQGPDATTQNAARLPGLISATGLDPSKPINVQTSTPISNGDVLGQGVADATNPPAVTGNGTTPGQTLADASIFNMASLTWPRIAAFIIGAIALVIGLSMLKQTQIVVQNVAEKVSKTAELASVAA